MTGREWQSVTGSVGSFWRVIDYSDLEPGLGAALLLICTGCGHPFYCDYEERFCAVCVKRRELLNVPPTA